MPSEELPRIDMHSIATFTTTPTHKPIASFLASSPLVERHADERASRHVADTLKLLEERLAPRRRVVHAGDIVYRAGDRFGTLYILNSGVFKLVNLAADGREQVVGLKFRGDWLGFDGIAGGQYGCDAIAMDTGEVWVVRYDALLAACAARPALMGMVHEAMSREIARDRDSL